MSFVDNAIRQTSRVLLLATASSVAAFAAHAQSDGAMEREGTSAETTQPAGPIVSELVREAALVFRGRVANLDYARAEQRGGEGATLPVTLVTYEIDEILKGAAPGETITLRFLGGPTGRPGQYLLVEGYPSFDVGEDSFLFVAENAGIPCPLVDCAEGRFRIVDGQVYTDMGRQLLLGEGGTIIVGGYNELDEVVSSELPVDEETRGQLQELGAQILGTLPPELRERLGEGDLEALRNSLEVQPVRPVLRRGGEEAEADAIAGQGPQGRGDPLNAEEFGRLIGELAGGEDARERLPSIANVTADEPLVLDAPEAAPPSASQERAGVSDQEQQELELFELNEGNPALPER